MNLINNNTDTNIVAVTSGEPAGIGPEICLEIFTGRSEYLSQIVVLADIRLLQARAKLFGKFVVFNLVNPELNLKGQLLADKLNIIDISCNNIDCIGKLDVSNVSYVIAMLDCSIQLAKSGQIRVIVTAPVSKSIINSVIPFSGHTEYFADSFGVSKVVMMLANSKMRVALVTTHLPLSQVAKHITYQNVYDTIVITANSLASVFAINNPRIAVCGLNPHAGEDGVLGFEEINIINPVISDLVNKGINVSGSYPADTIFNSSGKYDVYIAMYHDQGLPVLKYCGFGESVNITLGLPILRVSVDHGTALDIATLGQANPNSLFCALDIALSKVAS